MRTFIIKILLIITMITCSPKFGLCDPGMQIHEDLKGKFVCIKEVEEWNICMFESLTYNDVEYNANQLCFLNSILAPGDDLEFLQPLTAFAGKFYEIGCLKKLASDELSELSSVKVVDDTSKFNLVFSFSVKFGAMSVSFDFNPSLKGFGETVCGSFTDLDFKNPDCQLNVCVGGQYLTKDSDFKTLYDGKSAGYSVAMGPMSINAIWSDPIDVNWDQPVITACFDLLGANMFSLLRKAIGIKRNINKVVEFKKKMNTANNIKLLSMSICDSNWITEDQAKQKYPMMSKVILGISKIMNRINQGITGKSARFRSKRTYDDIKLMMNN